MGLTMLKLLLIQHLKDRMFHYGPPSAGSTRWKPVFGFVLRELLGKDISTKNGRKVANELDLNTVDFSLLSDEKLIEFSELVHRRFYVCM